MTNEERIRKVIEMARPSHLEHSAKGTTWKNHKYVKKEGDRYFYNDKQLVDIDEYVETPNFEELPEKVDKYRPEWLKKFINGKVWSPNKEDRDTLVAKGQDAIAELFDKYETKRAKAKPKKSKQLTQK